MRQIKLRASRIGGAPEALKFLCETNLAVIADIVGEGQAAGCCDDSIQTMYSDDVAFCAGKRIPGARDDSSSFKTCKGDGDTFFIVGHVTKKGTGGRPQGP